jgi:hypothetical protein
MNLKKAKALSLDVAPTLIARADGVVEQRLPRCLGQGQNAPSECAMVLLVRIANA